MCEIMKEIQVNCSSIQIINGCVHGTTTPDFFLMHGIHDRRTKINACVFMTF